MIARTLPIKAPTAKSQYFSFEDRNVMKNIKILKNMASGEWVINIAKFIIATIDKNWDFFRSELNIMDKKVINKMKFKNKGK
jgi:hypothetical protein